MVRVSGSTHYPACCCDHTHYNIYQADIWGVSDTTPSICPACNAADSNTGAAETAVRAAAAAAAAAATAATAAATTTTTTTTTT